MPRRDPLAQLRKLCLALPETTEKIAWGEPTFRVREKLFAMFTNNHHGDGVVGVWCKAPPGVQEILVGANPKRFYRPPYVGHKGWIGIRLDDAEVDWAEVGELLEDSYRLTVPKRLLPLLDQARPKNAGAPPAPPTSARSKSRGSGARRR